MSGKLHSPHGNEGMDRITVRLPTGQLDAVEAQVDQGEYANRSEAIRDAVREKFNEEGGRP